MVFEITDSFGEKKTLQPRVQLYSVKDFMGKKMSGIAVMLDEVNKDNEIIGQYSNLTVSFGEFISLKNSAYIDTNNCDFTDQLLKYGIATPTGLTKRSGFCEYPLWIFNEQFLRENGGEEYHKYATEYNKYMCVDEDEELTVPKPKMVAE